MLRPGCCHAGAWVAKTRAALLGLIGVLSPPPPGFGIGALAAQIVVSLARSHAGVSFMGAPGHDRVAAMSTVAMIVMALTVISARAAFVSIGRMVSVCAPEVPMMIAAPIKRVPIVVVIVVIEVGIGPRQQEKGVDAPEQMMIVKPVTVGVGVVIDGIWIGVVVIHPFDLINRNAFRIVVRNVDYFRIP